MAKYRLAVRKQEHIAQETSRSDNSFFHPKEQFTFGFWSYSFILPN